MTANVRFVDSHELNVDGKEGYLRGMLDLGIRGIVENAFAAARVVAVGKKALPILIVNPEARNCDLCSQMAHHVHYARDEVLIRTPGALKWLVGLAYNVFEWGMRQGQIDRVVYINNWLFSTNPVLELTSEELDALGRFIRQNYPNHAQVVRSVQPDLFPDQYELFLDSEFALFKSRDVFVWSINDYSYRERKNYKLDSRLLERSPIQISEPPHLDSETAERLCKFYRELYLQKHNDLNACLTEQFFAITANSNTLQYRLLTHKGKIAGFYCFVVVRDVLLAIALGYDRSVSRKEGLYRQVVMCCIQEARAKGLTLSFSAGVDQFKASRGGQPITEYEAVYFKHLSLQQQLAWRLLQLKCKLSLWIRRTFWRYG